jgi:hypothetical protein
MGILLGAAAVAAALWAYASQPRAGTRVVPIQDGKTIDFSSGRPAVRDTPDDRQAIDAAVKRMDAAAGTVTFQAEPPKPK